jgi:hypothetical protein
VWTFLHAFGIDDTTGRWYAFWSGAGSDIGELAIVGALIAMVRQHNCEVHRCWRLGRHVVEGTGQKVCRKHHPEGHLTAAHVRERYHLYLGKGPGRG